MQPNIVQLVRRGLAVRSLPENAAYALGRFPLVRSAYAVGQAASQAVGITRPLEPAERTAFPGIDIASAVRSLRTTSVFKGLNLSPSVVHELSAFARTARCEPRHGGPPFFHYADVQKGRLPSGQAVVIGDVLDLEQRPVIDALARDPSLLAIVHGYLGYRPVSVDKWLHWSFASGESSDARREQGQTIDYHYDVHGYNFIYANFYLTDCDERSGAHAYIENSHRQKPLRWLFDTARKSDEAIHAEYGREREHVVIAPAGAGFIEDASCYHKALAPLDRDRLLLQFRYF